jgi:hypothetical protein
MVSVPLTNTINVLPTDTTNTFCSSATVVASGAPMPSVIVEVLPVSEHACPDATPHPVCLDRDTHHDVL